MTQPQAGGPHSAQLNFKSLWLTQGLPSNGGPTQPPHPFPTAAATPSHNLSFPQPYSYPVDGDKERATSRLLEFSIATRFGLCLSSRGWTPMCCFWLCHMAIAWHTFQKGQRCGSCNLPQALLLSRDEGCCRNEDCSAPTCTPDCTGFTHMGRNYGQARWESILLISFFTKSCFHTPPPAYPLSEARPTGETIRSTVY